MNEKMKDPECVKKKVNIAPHDYSKENYLATFTPQKQLTPEQIFWSKDLIKMKAEALKEQTTTSRPIKALTVYPPNTPATLVPRMLPTKSQVKINIFALIQLFSEFEKTCKMRITPTGLTEGERGFEQTKECYLTEVIPFFKTLKDHFEGIQKALTKEIKEMKEIFEELEAEVDQNVVNRKHDEIERKHFLIANDNEIADNLSKTRCLKLEAELSKLCDKVKKDDHIELVKRFSNLEVVQIVLWYLDSKCSKHMTGNRSQLMNFVSEFMGTVRFVNDQIAKIIGYGDYQLGNIIILRNLEGVDLLSGSRDTNLYTISLDDILKTSPICLLSKASKTKSWLWHRRLSHLKFGTLNKLAKDSLARGIPKLKFKKDHLCSACALGKSKKSSHQPKAEDTNQEKLYLQHMDLCGLMRV
ncbi:retrovirus-related pol polyprotein from transposon TNT 1-94 [Tanacetum coccineum]